MITIIGIIIIKLTGRLIKMLIVDRIVIEIDLKILISILKL